MINNKYLSKILMIGMIFFCMFSITQKVWAAESDFLISASGEIVKYTGSGGDVTIPDVINGVTVKSMSQWLFYKNSKLTTIILPNAITNIGKSTFENCERLTRVYMGDKVESIHEEAFYGCYNLTWIHMSNSLKTIGRDAFADCSSLTRVILPSSLKYIGTFSFYNCTNLSYVIFNGPAPALGSGFDDYNEEYGYGLYPETVFRDTPSTLKLYYNASQTGFSTPTWNGYNTSTFVNDPNYIFEPTGLDIGLGITIGYNGLERDLTIPAVVNGVPIDIIGPKTFLENRNLTSVTIQNGVAGIDKAAFADCTALTKVTIPATVTSVQEYAFNGCSSLQYCHFEGNAPTNFGGYVFTGTKPGFKVLYNANNTSFSNPWNGLNTDVYNKDFTIDNSGMITKYNGLGGDVKIPSIINAIPVKGISNSAFSCSVGLTSLNICDGVTSIGQDAFWGCTGLISVIIPNSVTSIGDGAFGSCTSLKFINIPNNITSIGNKVFAMCSKLAEINIPSNIKRIGENAFGLCSKLTNIIIPYGVTSIGSQAFSDCSGLSSVTFYGAPPSMGQNVFASASADFKIYFCCDDVGFATPKWNGYDTAYLNSSGLGFSINNLGIVTSYSGSRSDVTIPPVLDGIIVTGIGEYAFYGCESLTDIIIPSSVTSIGNHAFDTCGNLTSINLHNGITNIGDSAFWGCYELKNITIPSSVTNIGKNAFALCSNFSSATFNGLPPVMGLGVFDWDSSNFKIYYNADIKGYSNPTWYGYKTAAMGGITYSGNGNTEGTVPVDNNTYTQDLPITLMGNTGSLVRTGYTFAGWNTTVDGSGTSYSVGKTLMMGSTNVNLYAQWISNTISTITFNSNGGSIVGNQLLPYNVKITKPLNPTKTGYTLEGWYTDSNLTTAFDFDTLVTTNITLYAKWSIITGLNVIVITNKGSFTGSTLNYSYGDTVKVTSVPAEGYKFVNWTDKTGIILSTNETYSFIITRNIELIANFTDKYDVNNDGKVDIADLQLVSQNYNTNNLSFDFNKDGVVDIFDLAICSKMIQK